MSCHFCGANRRKQFIPMSQSALHHFHQMFMEQHSTGSIKTRVWLASNLQADSLRNTLHGQPRAFIISATGWCFQISLTQISLQPSDLKGHWTLQMQEHIWNYLAPKSGSSYCIFSSSDWLLQSTIHSCQKCGRCLNSSLFWCLTNNQSSANVILNLLTSTTTALAASDSEHWCEVSCSLTLVFLLYRQGIQACLFAG